MDIGLEVGVLRDEWHGHIKTTGAHCPVCDRWGKIYGISLNRTMAKSLIWLLGAKKDEDGWADVPQNAPRWIVRSNQLTTLKRWNLVERRPNDPESKTKFSGMWRPTELGCSFANRQTSVPKKVFTYHDVVQGFSDDLVTIDQCFDEVFDYEAMMSESFAGEV